VSSLITPPHAIGMLIDSFFYSLPIDATPVKLRSSTALGSMVPHGLKDILDRVGLSPNRWF
jgi:hypothetical protein